MTPIIIKKVETKKELETFIDFHYDLYKGNEYDVPNLFSDELNTLDKKKNSKGESTVVIPMGCRSILGVLENEPTKTWGRFNIGVATLNLPYIALESEDVNKEKSIKLFHPTHTYLEKEVENFEVLPNILNFVEENIGKSTAVTNQNRKFVEQVFTLVLQEGNLEKLELVWNKQQKNYYQTYPVFTFNQRTKEINYVQQEKMLALKDIPKYQYYVSNTLAELQISEFEFADFMERIEVTVNVSMQVRIGVQELVSSDFSKQNIPFMIEMADKDAVAYTKLLHTIDPKAIQEEFLEMFAEFQFKPTIILVSGLFGVYLSNVLSPLAKRMSIKIKQVDNLPTFNRLTPEERILSFLHLYGLSV